MAIDHVSLDDTFRSHPTPALYGFESYISMPIVRADGRMFGTLCAIDPRPARVNTPEAVGMFKLFAELIAFHLDAHERLARSEAILLDERRTAELREQFIAVLGHDLRNPLASIDAGARLLLKAPHDERAGGILSLVQASVGRMTGLIDNLLDFARGRLGGGMSLARRLTPLEPVVRQVVDELRATHPDRSIVMDLSLAQPVDCDPGRIAQLLSNLVGNALTHGAIDVRDPRGGANGRRRLRAVGRQRRRAHREGDARAPVSAFRCAEPWARVSKDWGSASSSPPRSPAPTAAN